MQNIRFANALGGASEVASSGLNGGEAIPMHCMLMSLRRGKGTSNCARISAPLREVTGAQYPSRDNRVADTVRDNCVPDPAAPNLRGCVKCPS